MNLCSDGHDEVCYMARECPVCLLMNTVSELEEKVGDLEAANDALQTEYDEAVSRLSDV